MTLKALAFNCTLKQAHEASSTGLLLQQLLAALEKEGVLGDLLRVNNYNIKPGVSSDEGAGDDWPDLRRKILDSDIVILGTPVWLGQPSSICKRVLERMDAFLSETDDEGRMSSFGRIGAVAVTGNEDGAHHITAELYQAMADVGFTIPTNASTYWVGEAMGSTDYKDLEETPEKVKTTTAMVARHTAHLARLLKENPYPGAG